MCNDFLMTDSDCFAEVVTVSELDKIRKKPRVEPLVSLHTIIVLINEMAMKGMKIVVTVSARVIYVLNRIQSSIGTHSLIEYTDVSLPVVTKLNE